MNRATASALGYQLMRLEAMLVGRRRGEWAAWPADLQKYAPVRRKPSCLRRAAGASFAPVGGLRRLARKQQRKLTRNLA